jgi:hypothetical protein
MKPNLLRILAILAMTVGYFGAQVPAAGAAGQVTLAADKAEVSGGEQFTVSVMIDETPGLFGAQLSLAYDNTKLAVVEVQPGPGWPAGSSFVAVNRHTAGGTSAERIEFAATLINSQLTVPAGALVNVVFEALAPAQTVTTAIADGPTFPLLLATINGQSIPVTPPQALEITVGPQAEILGAVTLQAAAPGRTVTVEVASPALDVVTQVVPGAAFSVAVPAAKAYTLTVSAPCHASAQVSGVSAPTSGFSLQLGAGDVNGDERITIQDIAALGNLYGTTGMTGCANVNGDEVDGGTVDMLDIVVAAGNFGAGN